MMKFFFSKLFVAEEQGRIPPSKSTSTRIYTTRRIWKVEGAEGKVQHLPCLLFLLLLTACSPTNFRTKAVYEATENGYRMEIVGWGEIDRELELAYLGEYDVTFSPIISGDVVSFSFRYPDKTDPYTTLLTWRGQNGEQTLEDLYIEDILGEVLAVSGYSTFNEGEFEETIFAIYAISSGPQATIKEADAKFLKVIEVVENYRGE
jgi:hypothetical protein